MLVDNIKTFHPEQFIKIREDKRGDWSEIAVYVEAKVGQVAAAIVTHPCRGAKWFVLSATAYGRGVSHKTRKGALEAAIAIAKESDTYQRRITNSN
jgi:hypothetical protein